MYNVYRMTSSDPNKLAAEGWDLLPPSITGGVIVAFKDVHIPFEDPLVANLLKEYDSEAWQSCALDGKKAKIDPKYYEEIGYRFERVYDELTNKTFKRMILDDKAKDALGTWRVEADYSSNELRLTPLDISFPYFFPNAKVLDRYAPEIIGRLKSLGLIESVAMEE